MQATVRSYDAATRSGDVLLDDGTLLPFGADAFDRSGLRLLRLGQRVRLLLDDVDGPDGADGAEGGTGRRVAFLTLSTFVDPL